MSGVVVAVRPAPRSVAPGRRRVGPSLPTSGVSRRVVAAGALAFALTATGTVATVAAPHALPAVACSPGAVAGLTDEQRSNAAAIIAVGNAVSMSPRAQIVAVATAMQESGLRNLDYGDRDSLGLFQQRPSQGWGTPAQVTDPVHAAHTFYRHLMAIPGWERMPVTVAAQTVQRSAFPGAYAKWEPLATQLVTGATCTKR